MRTNLPEPERWSELPARGATAENQIGVVFRRVREATEPSDAAVTRLSRRVDASVPRSARTWLVWRLVVAAILLMATGGAVGAALMRWRSADADDARRPAARAAQKVGPTGATPARSSRHRSRTAGMAAEVAELASPPVIPPSILALGPPVVAPETPPPGTPPPPAKPSAAAPAAAPPAAAPRNPALSAAAIEAGALASAFRQLRGGGDAAAALRSLDAYDRRFPRGALRSEARIARVEALMALDRRREALPLLEQMGGGQGSGGALTRDVRTTRGELLADAGRCADARRDLDAVLLVRENDAAGGRALYARASCHLRAGALEPAREDLRRYLALHPNGPFAPAARRALGPAP